MSILDEKIGGRQRILTVVKVTIQSTGTFDGGEADKVHLYCKSLENQDFMIDEALIYGKNNEIKSKGLWVSTDANGKIRENSVLAQLVNYYGGGTPNDLVNTEITALPKKNNYLAVVIDDKVTNDSLPW